jgi:hypothetical protein
MNISKEELNSLQFVNGLYALIKPEQDFQTYQMNGEETDILVSNSNGMASQHFSVKGEVIAAPSQLTYNGDAIKKLRQHHGYHDKSVNEHIEFLKRTSVLYEVPVEIQRGQQVMFNYQQYFDANKNGRAFIVDGEAHYLIRYDELVCSMLPESKSEIYKMLNGLLLVEPLKIPVETHGGISVYKHGSIERVISGSGLLMFKQTAFGVIRKTGAICTGYREFPNLRDDTFPLTEGMIVAYDPRFGTNMEYDLHRTLTKNKSYRIHRKDLIFVYPNETDFDIHAVIDTFVK